MNSLSIRSFSAAATIEFRLFAGHVQPGVACEPLSRRPIEEKLDPMSWSSAWYENSLDDDALVIHVLAPIDFEEQIDLEDDFLPKNARRPSGCCCWSAGSSPSRC